eukprot:16442964-Heterocapsa_arctica.AAC.1
MHRDHHQPQHDPSHRLNLRAIRKLRQTPHLRQDLISAVDKWISSSEVQTDLLQLNNVSDYWEYVSNGLRQDVLPLYKDALQLVTRAQNDDTRAEWDRCMEVRHEMLQYTTEA